MQKRFIQVVILLIFANISVAKQVLLPNFTDLVKQTGDAVVNITVRHNAKEINNYQNMPRSNDPLERFFGIPRQQPRNRDSYAGGSGFVISSDGYILTNRHVVHDADEITVRFVDRREFSAKLIGEDEASDIALIKVEAENLPALKIGNAKKAEIGQWVMAIGSPMSFEHSVTKGIISAKGRSFGRQQYVPYIQTDVPINPGNSGGPLINMNGEVIGVNTLIISNTGGYMGLSFSIPIDVAMGVVKQLKTTGTVKRGLLGVIIQPVSQKLADALGLDKPQGALVTSVNKDSAAEKAGIEVQDVIVEFNGVTVDTSSSLPPLVGSVPPNTKVDVVVVRDGKRKTFKVKLDGLDADEVATLDNSGASKTLSLGFEIANLTDDIKQQLEVEHGVIVKDISNRDVQRAGLKVNDVILKLGKTKIKSVKQFKNELKKLEKNEPIVLLVKQNGTNRFIVIERN